MKKQDRCLLFGSPDFAPNTIAVSNALVRHTELEVVWLVADPSAPRPLSLLDSARLRIVKHHSVRGLREFLTSKWVFVTHGIFGNPAAVRGQVIVQLWHGMPIKAIERLEGVARGFAPSYVVAASTWWQDILGTAFGTDSDHVLATGMPRCELMLQQPSDEAVASTRSLVGARSYQKLAIWLPTYRASVVGDIRTDGRETGDALQIGGVNLATLSDAFAEADALCLVKRHPMSPHYPSDDLDNLVFRDDGDLAEARLDLYTLLGMADALLTDLSSVWIDYLVRPERPILFFMPDFDEYAGSRRLVLEPYGRVIPGPLVTSFEDLLASIRGLWSESVDGSAARGRARDLYNGESTKESSLRLLRALGLAAAPRG